MGGRGAAICVAAGTDGYAEPVLGSILTRQYRFATRGVKVTLRAAQQAVDVAGGVVGEVAGRIGLGNGHGESDDVVTGTVVPEAEPRPEPHRAAPERPAAPEPAPPPPAAEGIPAPEPRPAAPEPRPAAPEPAPPPPAAQTAPAPSPESEPAHVSTEPELVEELADPGAEDGAGAEVRVVGEPWPGYRHLKARDVIARLPSATREELAAIALFEAAGANRKSVVAAAQRALKQATPPGGRGGS